MYKLFVKDLPTIVGEFESLLEMAWPLKTSWFITDDCQSDVVFSSVDVQLIEEV